MRGAQFSAIIGNEALKILFLYRDAELVEKSFPQPLVIGAGQVSDKLEDPILDRAGRVFVPGGAY